MALKKATTFSKDLVLVLSVLGIIVALNVVSTWWFKRLDLTENKVYSISPATKQILKKLDDIINVTVYMSEDLPPQVRPLQDQVRDVLSEFKAYGRNLRIAWVDPGENEDLKQQADEIGVHEIQLNTYEKDKAAVMRAYMGIAVIYGDNKEVIDLAQGMENLEYDLTAAIMRVSRTETPKVAVLKTDTTAFIPPSVRRQMQMRQKDPTEELYQPIFESLGANYTVELVDISDGQPIDPSFQTLIVPGGNSFTQRDLFEIDQYFMGGGNLIVAVDAIGINFQFGQVNANVQQPRIIDLLEHYGARVESKMVLDVVCGQVQVPQRVGMFQMNVARDYPYFVAMAPDGFKQENPAVGGRLGQVILPWVSPITLTVASSGADSATMGDAAAQGVTAEVLAASSPRSWAAAEPFDLNPTQQWDIPTDGLGSQNLLVHLSGSFTSYFKGKSVPPKGDAVEDDTLSQIQLKPGDANREIDTDNTDAHLVVAGDSDFMTKLNATPGNITLLQNLVDWLTLDDNLIHIRTRPMADRTLLHERLGEDSALPTLIRWINILLMPAVLIAVGLLIYLRRREPAAAAPSTPSKPEEKSA